MHHLLLAVDADERWNALRAEAARDRLARQVLEQMPREPRHLAWGEHAVLTGLLVLAVLALSFPG